MPFYELNLLAFVAANAFLLYRQYRAQEPVETLLGDDATREQQRKDAKRFALEFFPVYALAVAADWLQGPHIYAIYRYEKEMPEKIVAMLYASGFVSGAVGASFAGQLADRYGRRVACLVYCGCYVITCLSMLSDNLAVLFVGRAFGGIATTLLFSVFEAWMITEFHAREVRRSGLSLSTVFANMTALSGSVAILAGVVGEILVKYFGSRTWPFVASIVCCVGAAILILASWPENYGETTSKNPSLGEAKNGLLKILKDSRVFALAVASCCFEGTMYLFVFFWSAALQGARTKTGSEKELPFGLIFSSFMCAMMTGSALFSLYNRPHSSERAAFVLMLVVLIVSLSLSAATVTENEHLLFWTLCLIEAAIGAYYPSMAYLKSERIEDGVRGAVYSIMRLPLNVFVVVAHSLDEEGDKHRNHVFLTCAVLLMAAFCIIKRNL
ncbi:Fc.00g042660.m01.CDS01 [Cosmosporella sp. VM-42]